MKKVPNLDPLYLDLLYNLSKICNFSSLADFQLIIICTLSHPGWWHACIFLLLLHSLSLCCLSASSTSSGLSLLSCVSWLMWFWRNDERDRVLNNCFDVPPVLRSTGSTLHGNTIIRYLKVGLFLPGPGLWLVVESCVLMTEFLDTLEWWWGWVWTWWSLWSWGCWCLVKTLQCLLSCHCSLLLWAAPHHLQSTLC